MTDETEIFCNLHGKMFGYCTECIRTDIHGKIFRPIATAPKDGTIVELYNEHTQLQDTGRWDRGEWTTDLGNGEMTHWRPSN